MRGTLTFTESGFETQGLNAELDGDVRSVVGPRPGVFGAVAANDPVEIRLDTDLASSKSGAVALWVQSDEPKVNGVNANNWSETILSAPDGFKLGLAGDAVCQRVDFQFDPKVWGVSPVLVPSLPGPQWFHLAFAWDADAGRYDAWLNGTPLRSPGTDIKPWTFAPRGPITLAIGRFAVADLTLFDEPLTCDQVAPMVPPAYRRALDNVLGAVDRGQLDAAELAGETIIENPLATEKDLDDWVMEGYGDIGHENGWMTWKTSSTDEENEHGHSTFWMPDELPPDFVARWRVQPLSEHGLCIVFIAATAQNGGSIFDSGLAPRDGNFNQYTKGDINSYHMSYYANTPFNPGRITCNMRKNSGFHLVENGPPGIPAFSNDVHDVAVVKQGDHIQLAVDGRLVIDYLDDGQTYGPVLGRGRFGLRQMRWMEAQYRDLIICRLK